MSESRWIPLESNPDVFNSWAINAGLASQAQFEDIYGLDPELLGMVSGGVKAVTLLFPCSGSIATKRKEEDEKIAAQGQYPIDPIIFWMKQTIVNACGTMGLLHALINSGVAFADESPLAKFIEECKDKTPLERVKVLEETSLFEQIHTSAAVSGQTTVPDDLDTYLHFTCFVKAPDVTARDEDRGWRVVELDGGRNGPIDRGKCTNLLQDVANFVKEHYIKESKSVNFSMMALCSAQH